MNKVLSTPNEKIDEMIKLMSLYQKRKIIYSPGLGAGWTTWNEPEVRDILLTWSPLVKAIERGEQIDEEHYAIVLMKEQVAREFGNDAVERLYLSFANLKVLEVACRIFISEHNGHERVILESDLY